MRRVGPWTTRAGSAAVTAALALGSTLATPATPAHASGCGSLPPVPCVKDIGPGLPDFFGSLSGWTCGGLFYYYGEEGGFWYSGPVAGATYAHTDAQTRRMSVTCSVRDDRTDGFGMLRGSVTGYSVAPLNNIASAAGLVLDYWRETTTERVYICTAVSWVDRLGISHTHRYDHDTSFPGAQCPELVPVIDM